MTIIDMFDYEESSHRRQLKVLYRELDETTLSYELGTDYRKCFFRRMRGRFIHVCSLKRDMSIDQALDFLEIFGTSTAEVESGIFSLSDKEFNYLVTFLGCANDIPIFLEKIEMAMIPGLRDSRKKFESTLKIYGFRFADSEDK